VCRCAENSGVKWNDGEPATYLFLALLVVVHVNDSRYHSRADSAEQGRSCSEAYRLGHKAFPKANLLSARVAPWAEFCVPTNTVRRAPRLAGRLAEQVRGKECER